MNSSINALVRQVKIGECSLSWGDQPFARRASRSSSKMTSRPPILHMGVPKPLIDAGVAARFAPHRLPAGSDITTVPAEIAAAIRGIAAGGGHDPINARVMDALPKLEIVASFGVGYDHIDAREAARRGIIVTHTPDVLTDDVADTALGLLLASIRQFPQAEQFLRAGNWLNGSFPLTASVKGRKIGILGLGRIGKAIGRRLEGFGVSIAYCGRKPQADVSYPYFPDVLALAAAVDTLVIAAPGGAETDRLVNAAVLAALGPEGIVINVGRGSVIDEPALISALQNRTILGAGLDVFAGEPMVPAALIALDNVVLLPHVASGSIQTRNAMAELVVSNLAGWFDGKGPVTPVPETR
jgi:lactate dehydrogenase-like 2-hydroxyacid dehydrogenase